MAKNFLDYTGLTKYTEKVEAFIATKISGLVPSTRKVNGKALSSDITLSASDVGAQAAGSYVPTSRTVNDKALSSNITLSASDVGARPDTWTPTASDVGAVPTSRTVNGKALSSNITLSASDVGARSDTWTPTASDVSALPTAGGIMTGTIQAMVSTTSQTTGDNRAIVGKTAHTNSCIKIQRSSAENTSGTAEVVFYNGTGEPTNRCRLTGVATPTKASDAAPKDYVDNAIASATASSVGKSMADESVKPTSDTTVTAGTGAEIFNDYRSRTFSNTTVTAGNVASGEYSHAEGLRTTSSGKHAHAEGISTESVGNSSHAEGSGTESIGTNSHAEGMGSISYGSSSHAEGSNTFSFGIGSHSEGVGTIAEAVYCYFPIKSVSGAVLTVDDSTGIPGISSMLNKITSGMKLIYWNDGVLGGQKFERTIASVDLDLKTITVTSSLTGANLKVTRIVVPEISYDPSSSTYAPHSEGYSCVALGNSSHAEGQFTLACVVCSHAEGEHTKALSASSHAEGDETTASGVSSHAEGLNTEASGQDAHAEGCYTIANGIHSHAEGFYTTASNFASHTSGKYNKDMTNGGGYNTQNGDVFVIGNGYSVSENTTLSNALRLAYEGTLYLTKAYKSTGADYAEYFEWLDGNPENEDRVGRFVTLEGNKLRLAQEGDYILGVVSGQPCIIGNADEDWLGRWEHDDFNRFVKEYLVHNEVEVTPPTDVLTDEDALHVWILNNNVEERDGHYFKMETEVVDYPTDSWRHKANPNYDASQPYIERQDRKEWDAVGMIGVLSVLDDGTCQVNSYAKVRQDGVATGTNSLEYAKSWRVVARVTPNIVKIVFSL